MQRYDIVLIQEIRDISETTMDKLVDAVNTDAGFVSCLALTHMSFTHSSELPHSSSSSINTERIRAGFSWWGAWGPARGVTLF